MRRLVRWLVGVVAVVGLVAVGFWAGRTALEPPSDPLVEAAPVTYTVANGQVGRTLQFSAVAEWELEPVGVGAVRGVVTTVELDSTSSVGPGDILFTVDLRPVVVAEGVVPSFRDLSQGAKGADVAQLQVLLAGLGFYAGEVDGSFGTGVRTAVRGWQRLLCRGRC
jgi:hypothetical protein